MKKLRQWLLIALLAAPAVSIAQDYVPPPDEKSKFLGLEYKGVLMNEKVMDAVHRGGGLITGFTNDKEPNYGISQWRKGTTRMLWLDMATGSDAKGIPRWQVKDVLVFPKFGKDQSLHFGGDPTCRKNGKENPALVVWTDFFPHTKSYKIRRAWLANTESEKFTLTDTQGIRCEYFVP